jgi:hypothetical protein
MPAVIRRGGCTDEVTFTASIVLSVPGGTATGTVQFSDNGTPLGAPVPVSGTGPTFTAELTTSTLTVGDHTITAAYSGDANVTARTRRPTATRFRS